MMIHISFLKRKIYMLLQLVIMKLSKYDYNFNFNPALLGNSIQMKDKPMTFISEFSKGDEFSDTSNDPISNKVIYTFKPHNSKYETKILQKYNLI